MLADYITLGIVTIIPWGSLYADGTKTGPIPPYNNNTMDRTRGIDGKQKSQGNHAGDRTEEVRGPISPPPLRYTADLSCYIRFV